ncbi:hypothetical protein LBMAG42_28380 [Deltaproteobacteria bacterium]|nr:hypothetical protein LBMAG42_28380 [Deltaproteobacteria bacterium]
MITFLALLAVPYVEAAQGGTVRGSVTDQDGLGIPGANVILTGPLISGQLITVSDDEGNYRFVDVPVGTHELQVLKTGFPSTKRKVKVKLDEAAFVPIELKVGAEEVIIEAPQAVLDTTRSSVSTEMSKESLDNLPVGRSYQDAVNILPGVSGRVDTSSGGPGDGNPSVRGEGQYGNNYLLDGISTRDTATKTFGSNVNFDAIEDIQVYTDGAPAEFGQATGMTVNVVTKDGGDEHFGSAGYYFGMDASAGKYLIADLTTHEEVPTEKRDFMTHSLSLLAGGPVIKEKLWYLASVDLGTGETTYEGQDPDAPNLYQDGGGFAKFTWFVTPEAKIRYQFNGQIQHEDNYDTSSQFLPETQEEYASNDIGNQLQVTWLPAPTTVLDIKGIYSVANLNVSPMSGDHVAAQVYDYDTGEYSGNASAFDSNVRTRAGFTFSVTQLASKALGDHRIKAGVEAWQLAESRTLDYTGPGNEETGTGGMIGTSAEGYPCTAPDYDDCYTRQEFHEVGALTHKSIVLSAYFQDDWQPVDFLTVNAGVRVDHEDLYTSQGTKILEQWMPAPRLGIAWDATRDSKTKVTLNAGQYYDVNGSAFAEWGDTRTSAGYDYYYGPYSQTEPYYSQGAYPLTFCNEQSLATLPDDEAKAAGEACNGELRPYHMDKIVLGIEREVFPTVAMGLKGILSQTVDLPEDINYDDYYWVISNPENKRRDYWAVEFTAEKEFDKHWQVLASYTLSEAKGAMPGQFETASGGGFGGNGNEVGVYGDDIGNPDVRADYFDAGYGEYVQGYAGLGSYSNDAGYYGYLPYHSWHSVKINGSYTLTTGAWNHTIGLIYEFDSGHAWQKRSDVPNYQDYLGFSEGRGSRFMPAVNYLDAHFAEEFKIDEEHSAELAIDVFNILDLDGAVTYYENDDENFGLTLYRQEPRTLRASVKVNY